MEMHTQYFNWRKYKLWKWQKYLSSCYGKRMHTDVWRFYHWEIPEWHHIHHKDHNPINNDISNLECVEITQHLSEHWREKWKDENRAKRMRNWLDKAREKAKEWHWSDEWLQWHKEHFLNNKDHLFKKKEHTCVFCSKEYLSNRNESSKFCSNNCKSAYRKKSWVDDEKRTCTCWNDYICNKYSLRKKCWSC